MKSRKSIWILLIVVTAFVVWFGFWNNRGASVDQEVIEVSGEITSFYLSRPNLVVETNNLESVSFHATPADRSLEDVLLGKGKLVEELVNRRTWTFEIPKPVLIRKMYVVGTDSQGLSTERVVFPIAGISEIFRSLWQNIPEEVVRLKVNEGINVEEDKFTFSNVLEDSRCPVNLECIRAGRVVAEVTFGDNKFVLSSNEDLHLNDKYISILDIFPEATEGDIDSDEYIVTFSIITDPSK